MSATHGIGVAGSILGLLLALVACTPSSEPTLTPTPISPVEVTPTETPSQRQTRLDFEAAEDAYRGFIEALNKKLRAGGGPRASPAMKSYAAGPYLKTFTTVVQAFDKTGSYTKGGFVVADVRYGAYSSSELNLSGCEIGSQVEVFTRSRSRGRQEDQATELTMRKVHGEWKAWSLKAKRVISC